MERELAGQCWVWVKLPYGEFVIDDKRDVVLFAGGTGITAFTAFLDHLDSDYPRNVFLVYGARNRQLLIYRDLVLRCLEKVPRLQACFFLEDGNMAVGGACAGPSCRSTGAPAPQEFSGRLALDSVWSMLRETSGSDYYISGPPQMVSAISRDLRTSGVADKSIRIDAWE
jgi:ferredoxin-NADP reductase